MDDFEQGVSREIAESDFDRFAKAARLKMNRTRNLNDKADVEQMREALIQDIMDGSVSINENGWPTINTTNEELPKVSFNFRPSFLVAKAMDNQKAGSEVAKTVAMIAEATRIAPARLFALDFRDMGVVQRVFALFLVE